MAVNEGTARVALVTGSTSGIGLAIAHALARKQCHVIISGFASESVINGITADLVKAGAASCRHVAADLTKTEDIQRMCQQIDELHPGGLDIIVNNAGFNYVHHVDGYPLEKWDAMIGVMLTAPFQLIRHSLPAMKKKRFGRIVNISSQMGHVSAPGKAVYSAAKSGIIGLTRGLGIEVAEYGITCNAICPAFVKTELTQIQCNKMSAEQNIPLEEAEAIFVSGTPMKKWVLPDQVAELVEFLCFSGSADSMTGASYLLDTGYTAQ